MLHYSKQILNSLVDGRALSEHMEDYYLETLKQAVVKVAKEKGDRSAAKLAATVTAVVPPAAAADAAGASTKEG